MFNVTILGGGGGVGSIITLDGGTINDEMEGGTSLNFSQDMVQEFQLSALNYDVSTGISTNGGVNIVTRSGTNDFHGSGYFYFRDHNMAAYPGLQRNTFNPNPFFARRNPGVSVGGPILKNKLFFFFNYEYMSQTSVYTEQQDLASLQPINGIFPSPYKYKWVNARFDYRISDKNTIFARYTHDGNQDFGPYGNNAAAVELELQQQLVGSKHHGRHQHAHSEPGERFPVPVSLLAEQRDRCNLRQVPISLHWIRRNRLLFPWSDRARSAPAERELAAVPPGALF